MSGALGATVAGTEGNLSTQEPSCAQHAQHTCPPTTADALQGAALSMQYQWPLHTCRLYRQTNAASPIVFDMSHDKKNCTDCSHIPTFAFVRVACSQRFDLRSQDSAQQDC